MSKRRLLLADDSMTIQKVVNLTFADEGIEVIAVSDGDAAMKKFVEATPDLVMVDVNMPGLDGYRLCEMIKQDEQTQQIPVILLVGSFEPFDEQEARRVGANDYLTKPFQSIRQLVNVVSDLLDAKTEEGDFLNPLDNAPVSNLADDSKTMPSAAFDSADAGIKNLGDAGMDDEMIQTAQIGSLPVDEMHKYESAPVDESFAEDVDSAYLKQKTNSESLTDELEGEDWAKTQPLSKNELEETVGSVDREKQTSALDFDNLDLLEFLTRKKESSPESIPVRHSEDSKKTEPVNHSTTNKAFELPIKFSSAFRQPETLSPETIEAIADRIVEKLSDKVIERIVREVISQIEGKR